ncbi:hypothetical protein [Reinekea blandensis]|uniref:Uncharacterized protein n=1 Tax=Reinekea blandensis MED297 TaxID=314283 RepID=A4BIZ6_9GAMM|nr:hypothetical protein [Reinekea blandensis]EAR07929.1 hypothetical protein MED297_15405 [Reinekea sp. MED297] [Reinekea blandensis MED297]
MKKDCLLSVALVLAGCASLPMSDTASEPKSFIQNTIIVEPVRLATSDSCPSAELDVSDRLCNLWQWQTYLQNLYDEPITDARTATTESEVSLQLQQSLQKLHPEQPANVQRVGLEELNGVVKHLEAPVADWFLLIMGQAQQRVDLMNQLSSLRETIITQEQSLENLRAELSTAEQKLDALTEIEQQLGDAP